MFALTFLAWCHAAWATPAVLPGVDLPFEVDDAGVWHLGENLPAAFVDAGVQAGWSLRAVDGIAMTQVAEVRRAVASGGERTVQLGLDTPAGETVLVVKRNPLVLADGLGLLPWPSEFVRGATGFQLAPDGHGRIVDQGGVWWDLDPATGALTVADDQNGKDLVVGVPEVWWHLSPAPWAVVTEEDGSVGDLAWARATLDGGLRLLSFQGQAFEHVLVPEADGIGVYAMSMPRGTPELPSCDPAVPESCLVAGRAIRASLLDRPGGREAAGMALTQACEGSVYRACVEAVSLAAPRLEESATACIADDVAACHRVGQSRLEAETEAPGALTVGVLEYACAKDASGTLGDRLRRVEQVGEGCWLLARAFDALGTRDRALLSLDQACMLGRAEACDEATRRREEAFALRTVRECEDESLPVAPSCTQLGRLLEVRPIAVTERDAFAAYLRGCELGDDEGCVALGDYVDRWGIAHPRVVEAERRLDEACKSGEQRACVGVAHLFVRHEPRTLAYGQALTLFAGACAEGLPGACVAGAEQRRKGTARVVVAPDAVAMWSSACDLGSPEGCGGYGERLSRDKPTWPDAFGAWTRACDIGSAASCTDLGQLVARPHEPLWSDEQSSTAYLTRGCDNGDAEGCYWLAEPSVDKKSDPPEAAYLLLEESCSGEFGLGCATLARVHLQRNTSFDDEIAAGHFQSACENGHFDSCKTLGAMYAKGKGVEKDRVRAREFAQRYSVNARRRHVRLGLHAGFPYLVGAEGELVAPIPVGPAISVGGSYSYLPSLGGVLVQLEGESYPNNPPDLSYWDVGVRLYPNNKARGLYGMVSWHQMTAEGGDLTTPLVRSGPSVRLGIHSENKLLWSRVEMGLGQYGMVDLHKFDEDETGSFPLILSVLGFAAGVGF